jgi:hypothetical protein
MSPFTNTVNRIPREDPRVLTTIPQPLTPVFTSVKVPQPKGLHQTLVHGYVKFKPSKPSASNKILRAVRGTEGAWEKMKLNEDPFLLFCV